MRTFNILIVLIKRECLLHSRNRTDLLNTLFFFIMLAVLFPMAITPDPKVLQNVGPGIIWVAALLATLLSLPKLFKEDYNDGSLEQLLLIPVPFSWLVFAKIMAHWILFNLPLILITPLLGMMFHLSPYTIVILVISLLIGSLLFNLLGSIGAALTVSLRNSGLLLALILLPLFVPTLIFGSSVTIAAQNGFPLLGPFTILAALLILAITLIPITAASILKLNISFD